MPSFQSLWPVAIGVLGFLVCIPHGIIWNILCLVCSASVSFAAGAVAKNTSVGLLHSTGIAVSEVATYFAVGVAMHLLWLGVRVVRGK